MRASSALIAREGASSTPGACRDARRNLSPELRQQTGRSFYNIYFFYDFLFVPRPFPV